MFLGLSAKTGRFDLNQQRNTIMINFTQAMKLNMRSIDINTESTFKPSMEKYKIQDKIPIGRRQGNLSPV